ncbi:lactate utilization protein [uncultured Pseudodesulfovibrio sp.]|uniref:LutC/YkgG family protein n=1 Tax=uncultured Pseudodesulfovibrio sp. TaxID=2035858 RepID=UPI0029C757B1|nr:lactate utilization protein [uncultured Pseudodesulfovibrio sp.]
MTNEEYFLKRIRKALGRKKAPDADTLFSSRPQGELEGLLSRADRNTEERLELLAVLQQAAGPLNLSVHVAKNAAEAGQAIADLARASETEWGGDKHILMHDDALLHDLDLPKLLADDPIAVDVARFNPGEDELAGKQRLRDIAEKAYIGLTSADWCAVDCAALALLSGPGHGRAVSLVPSIHIAVLPLDRLVADLPEGYALLEDHDNLPASFTFISGPSKTADIEAELVHGAHGPREMHVFVITG